MSLRAICIPAVAIGVSLAFGSDAGAQDMELFNSISWTEAPGYGKLGKVARLLEIPEGCRFTDARGAKKFMEFTENPVNGSEIGALVCESAMPGNPADSETWFVIFEYDAAGYVKDEEKSTLDSNKILATLREGQARGNEVRRRLGWDELDIGGWIRAPYYDPETHNLTWAVSVLANEDTAVNHSVRLLGRGGVLKADLVSDPGGFALALPTFANVIYMTEFVSGQKYSEWQDGDKVAAYGLTALVAGGAGAAAVKLGLFGKLWKVLAGAAKLVVLGLVAGAVWLKNLFTRKSEERSASTS